MSALAFFPEQRYHLFQDVGVGRVHCGWMPMLLGVSGKGRGLVCGAKGREVQEGAVKEMPHAEGPRATWQRLNSLHA